MPPNRERPEEPERLEEWLERSGLRLEDVSASRIAALGSTYHGAIAAELELRLRREPGDLTARVQLLGYHGRIRHESASAHRAWERHVLWILERAPASDAAGTHFSQPDERMDPDSYRSASELWARHLEERPDDPSVLWNACEFYGESQRALDLAERGARLRPRDPLWPIRIGHMHGRRGRHDRSLAAFESALAVAPDPEGRFHMLSDAAQSAFDAGAREKAFAYATELLEASERWRADERGCGNAIHDANTILGRLALLTGDRAESKRRLSMAGHTPGSPNLNSFGPSMDLARSLLELGGGGMLPAPSGP
ncbi:MAG: hypothetical protein GY711_03975 [bacterium]|nr:hypothetical protein [bacterium]